MCCTTSYFSFSIFNFQNDRFTAADIPHLYVQLGDFNIASTADGPHEVRKIEKVILNKGFKIETYVRIKVFFINELKA